MEARRPYAQESGKSSRQPLSRSRGSRLKLNRDAEPRCVRIFPVRVGPSRRERRQEFLIVSRDRFETPYVVSAAEGEGTRAGYFFLVGDDVRSLASIERKRHVEHLLKIERPSAFGS